MTELEQIIELHEKLIYKIASKFHDVPTEDLFQVGIIGIIKAYNNYVPSSETKSYNGAVSCAFATSLLITSLAR